MNLKCLLGLHEWGEWTYSSRFDRTRQCQRCGKIQRKLLPPKLILLTSGLELTLHTSTVAIFFAINRSDLAKAYLEAWEENLKKEAEQLKIQK